MSSDPDSGHTDSTPASREREPGPTGNVTRLAGKVVDVLGEALRKDWSTSRAMLLVVLPLCFIVCVFAGTVVAVSVIIAAALGAIDVDLRPIVEAGLSPWWFIAGGGAMVVSSSVAWRRRRRAARAHRRPFEPGGTDSTPDQRKTNTLKSAASPDDA